MIGMNKPSLLAFYGRQPTPLTVIGPWFFCARKIRILNKSPLDFWKHDGTNDVSTSFAKLPLVDNSAEHDDES